LGAHGPSIPAGAGRGGRALHAASHRCCTHSSHPTRRPPAVPARAAFTRAGSLAPGAGNRGADRATRFESLAYDCPTGPGPSGVGASREECGARCGRAFYPRPPMHASRRLAGGLCAESPAGLFCPAARCRPVARPFSCPTAGSLHTDAGHGRRQPCFLRADAGPRPSPRTSCSTPPGKRRCGPVCAAAIYCGVLGRPSKGECRSPSGPGPQPSGEESSPRSGRTATNASRAFARGAEAGSTSGQRVRPAFRAYGECPFSGAGRASVPQESVARGAFYGCGAARVGPLWAASANRARGQWPSSAGRLSAQRRLGRGLAAGRPWRHLSGRHATAPHHLA
jgi:hypothetical protein